jgi:hypothetical protein
MDTVLALSAKQRVELFEQTTQRTGIEPVIVEKDFWVCWTLKELFQLPAIGEHLILKGGTSLSKVFKVIERFSEDIDVSIDRGFLGFGGANEPEAGASNKEKQRRIEALKTACQQKIAKELLPSLEAAIKAKVRRDERWSLRSDDEDPDRQTLLFDYPTSFAPDAAGYIRRMVKIEMGARADHWPSETRTITPYVAEQFPQGFKAPGCALKVLSAERTCREKATILHAEFHRPAEKPMPERFSRHYCDFYEMIRKGVAKSATAKPELLARVAQHKNLFFRTSWAHYGEATRGSLRIAPPERRVKALRDDYAKMQQMFFGEPPRFENIIALLSEWEREFNQRQFMAQSNHERVGKALEILNSGLKPFVERELKSTYQASWFDETRQCLAGTQMHLGSKADEPSWDAASLLVVMWNQWNDVFKKTLGEAERTLVSELREVRNKWAHQRPFSTDDANRALDSMQRLLIGVSATREAEDLDRQKTELLRLKFDEQARHEKRKAASVAIETQVVAGLKPWREVVIPHPDVASGRYQQAEFAADLRQVYKGLGTDEYRNPLEFFRRTYLTSGLKDLLARSLLRLTGGGGDPVVELQTNFGGGKTHSMLALYHLLSGTPKENLVGLEPVFAEAKTSPPAGVRRVVLVGNRLSPGQPERKDDGTVVRTMWGELAWQLGGKEGYAMIKQADETATNPGDALGRFRSQGFEKE